MGTVTTQQNWHTVKLKAAIPKRVNMLINSYKENASAGIKNKTRIQNLYLFYGDTKNAKAIATNLTDPSTGRELQNINVSQLISKFIGETEKNLSAIFDKAKNKNWILFFDEADALFGKRTGVRDAHDKYANQETAYLLQQVEGFCGIVIISVKHKKNIDKKVLRFFRTTIAFPAKA